VVKGIEPPTSSLLDQRRSRSTRPLKLREIDGEEPERQQYQTAIDVEISEINHIQQEKYFQIFGRPTMFGALFGVWGRRMKYDSKMTQQNFENIWLLIDRAAS